MKAVFEGDGITLRGDLRAKLPRDGLMDWRVEGEDLCLRSGGAPLVLTLGAKEAAAWVRALEKPLPTLAAKLGISATTRAWRIGGPGPEALAVALAGAEAPGPDDAALIIAVLTGPEDLAAALAAGRATGLRVWCVHGKGPGAAVGDRAVRAAFRAEDWMDIKASAVSAGFTATLYRPPV